jgi:hypothetical protein
MAISLGRCVEHLVAAGVRHHLDAREQVIRVVRLTREYRSLRDERLAILQITAPDDGRRCRVAIERAFAVGQDAARTCLDLCQAAAATPVVGVEFDAECENLRLVAEAVVEDGDLTPRQLVSMVDAVAEAAEIWHAAAGRPRLSAAG